MSRLAEKAIVFALASGVLMLLSPNVYSCSPNPDWFRKADSEHLETVKKYYRITGDLGWPYYRPYLQAKLLIEREQYADAKRFLTGWSEDLRGRSRGQILSPTALWALRASNIRILCLEMTEESPKERALALEACNMIDLGRKDLLSQVTGKLSSPLGEYLYSSVHSPTSDAWALELLSKVKENSPLIPLLMYRRVRYCGDHISIIARANEFLRNYPKHYLADDVVGWRARSYLLLGNKSKAVSEYLSVLEHYPNGDMVGPSIFSIVGILESNSAITAEVYGIQRKMLSVLRSIAQPPVSKENYYQYVKTLSGLDDSEEKGLRVLIPELLNRIIISSYSMEKKGLWFDRDYRKICLSRLIRKHPYHRYAANYARRHHFELSKKELSGLLVYCEDQYVRKELLGRVQESAVSHSMEEPTDVEWKGLLEGLPLGPDFFNLLSRKTHVAGSKKDSSHDLFLEKAFEILPLMESIPMTDEEYRLYALLFLRACTEGDNLAHYPEVREKTKLVSMNSMELKELDLLDAIYEWRSGEKSPSKLKSIIEEEHHPFRYSAGRILANDCLKQKKWVLMLWTALSCDMSYVGERAIDLAQRDSIQDMLADPRPIFDKVKGRLLVRRTCMALVERDFSWLFSYREKIQLELKNTEMQWLLKMVNDVMELQESVAHGTEEERLEGRYHMSSALYSPGHRVFDFYYDCYERLRALEPELVGGSPKVHARTLFRMATALVRTRDSNPNRFYYDGWERHRVGRSWLDDQEARDFIASPRLYLRAAELYEQCATLYSSSSLADDSLYWAAYCRKMFLKKSWRIRSERGYPIFKSEQKTKIKSLISKIIENYPAGDFSDKAKSFKLVE